MSRAEPNAARAGAEDGGRRIASNGTGAGTGAGRAAGPGARTGAGAGPLAASGIGIPTAAESAAAPGTGGPSTARTGTGAVRAPRWWWSLGLFRSELGIVFRRWRTLALLAVLAGVPLLVGIAVRIETGDGGSVGRGEGDGPAFIQQVSGNGLFLTFAALAATLPFFLPMAIGVVAGDAVAGEAGGGTLRYLLVAPAGRTRLLLAKFTAVLAFCLAGALTVALSGLVVGAVLFPVGDVTTLSGTTVPLADGILRALLIAVLVAASLVGLAALGLFVSTLTDSGVGAMAGTVGLLITVQIVDGIPQLHAVQPYLFPHYWLSFADVLRDPVQWTGIARNLGLQALYAAVFGSAAWARLTSRDITA
ncbi:ABC transporter permease [Actinacidiphila sp. ITFR-21]|uniref:ABC transporter permease n=1 Tax=Actinacidiphila sp. ITFR-21 TaxID=3075199 RepID=UPI00288A6F78|nr:ABC transporter permease subunit [Streptomyces sp. ITFR-21]WNI17193.1 ABC transporter permease subunit [Streptomyces sp. ITFR-21]